MPTTAVRVSILSARSSAGVGFGFGVVMGYWGSGAAATGGRGYGGWSGSASFGVTGTSREGVRGPDGAGGSRSSFLHLQDDDPLRHGR